MVWAYILWDINGLACGARSVDEAKRQYSVEIEGDSRGQLNPEVVLRFGPRGVSTGGDEFGGDLRLTPGEWVAIDGCRVRVRDLASADATGAANTSDWTRPELLISTPGGGGVRRLRLVLPAEEGSDILVGRSGRKNDIVLEDEHVSRRHVRIVVRGGRHMIEDLGSRWGTFINGARMNGPTPLGHGDEILAGKSVMRFVKFSDGFTTAFDSNSQLTGHAAHIGLSWRTDPHAEDGMTFTATTLLSMPALTDESPKPTPHQSVPKAEPDDARISQKLTSWMRKKGTSQ